MMIMNAFSEEICNGLNNKEAEKIAQEIANERLESVWLVYDNNDDVRFDPECPHCKSDLGEVITIWHASGQGIIQKMMKEAIDCGNCGRLS